MGSRGERGLSRLGVAEPPIVGDVTPEFLMHERRPGFDRGSEVRHRDERLPRDIDRCGCVGRCVRIFGNDERHRVAHMARLIRGEHRPAGKRHRGAVVGGDVPQHVGVAAAIPAPVLPGEHGEHAWHGPCPFGGDRTDARMCVRAADEGGVCLPRHADIVHEPTAAGQEAIVLQARLRRADMPHAGSPFASAAADCSRQASEAASGRPPSPPGGVLVTEKGLA